VRLPPAAPSHRRRWNGRPEPPSRPRNDGPVEPAALRRGPPPELCRRRASSGSGAELEGLLEGPAGRVITPEVYACAAHILYPDPETHVAPSWRRRASLRACSMRRRRCAARGPLAVRAGAGSLIPLASRAAPSLQRSTRTWRKSAGAAHGSSLARGRSRRSAAHTGDLPASGARGREACVEFAMQIKPPGGALPCAPHPRPCCALCSACSPPWA